MDKYTAPYSDVELLNNVSDSSIPEPGENEGDIIPWASWAN